ncbi:MAG: transposase family protein [Streptomycetaceae bacterium]|nr:transposase family protein [Streptomycetaceae bacterium]
MNTDDTCTHTDSTLLLGLEGMAVIKVEETESGLVVHVATTEEAARACPACGVLSATRKGGRVTRPRQLPYDGGVVETRWHKSRWYCAERLCPRTSFTEQTRQVPAGARLPAQGGGRRAER